MTVQEKIYYLLHHVKTGEYDINTFSNLFTDIINLEIKNGDFSEAEMQILKGPFGDVHFLVLFIDKRPFAWQRDVRLPNN